MAIAGEFPYRPVKFHVGVGEASDVPVAGSVFEGAQGTLQAVVAVERKGGSRFLRSVSFEDLTDLEDLPDVFWGKPGDERALMSFNLYEPNVREQPKGLA